MLDPSGGAILTFQVDPATPRNHKRHHAHTFNLVINIWVQSLYAVFFPSLLLLSCHLSLSFSVGRALRCHMPRPCWRPLPPWPAARPHPLQLHI